MQTVRNCCVLKGLYELLIMIQSESKHVAIFSDIGFEIELCLTDEFCFKLCTNAEHNEVTQNKLRH